MASVDLPDPYRPSRAASATREWSAEDAAAGAKGLVVWLAAAVAAPNVWMFVWVFVVAAFGPRDVQTARAGFPWASGFALLFASLAVWSARRFAQSFSSARRAVLMLAVLTNTLHALVGLILRVSKAQESVPSWYPLMREAADTFVVLALCASAAAFRGVAGVAEGTRWGGILVVVSLALQYVSLESPGLASVVGLLRAAAYVTAWILCLRCFLLIRRDLLKKSQQGRGEGLER